mgnify:FL=1
MRMTLEATERYPDYELDAIYPWDTSYVEVPEELFERYKKVLAEYEDVQKELAKLEQFPTEPTRTRSDVLKELTPLINDMFNVEYEAMEKRTNND